jgi:bifunctional DNase/RNase
MAEMIEVVIDSVRVSLTSTQRIVILKEADGDRYLPIWIGPYETESISIALQEIEVSRPQTHDLIKKILTTMEARLTKVEINNLKDDVFFGKLMVEREKKIFEIDSRPSDALAMAVRYNVPIFVEAAIFNAAGIRPEQDLRKHFNEEILEGNPPLPEEGDKQGADRLSVFEQFIDKLDLDEQTHTDASQKPDKPKPQDDEGKKKP